MTAAADRWLGARCARVALALCAIAAFVRLVLVLQVAGGPLARQHELVTYSDNRFNHAWAQQLSAGDWLQREPAFPMMDWMRQVAGHALSTDPSLPVRLGLAQDLAYDREAMVHRIWQHWLGERTYYQEPAYVYLVAATYWLFGPSAWHVVAWQLLLGCLCVLLALEIGRRLAGELAGLAAGVLAVLFPVLPFLELNLMRDTLVVSATLLVAFAALWAPGGGAGRWLAFGVLLGASVLVKQSFLFVAPLFAVARLATVRSPWPVRARTAALVAAGMAAGFAPAAVRNLLVGAPLLGINGSAASMLALFHTGDASPTALSASPVYVRILVHSDGKFWPSLVEAASTHSSYLGFFWLNLQKLLYAFSAHELPNNVDLYVFRQGAPALAWLPVTFPVIAVLSAAGLATRSGWERLAPVLAVVVAQIPTFLLALPLSRYRAPMAAAMLPLAGVGVVHLLEWAEARRFRRLAVASALAAGYILWALRPPPGHDAAARTLSYRTIASQSLAAREPSFAAMNLREAWSLSPGDAGLALELGRAHLEAQEFEEALAPLERAAQALKTAEAHEDYAWALSQTGRAEAAREQARQALALDPGRTRARAILDGVPHSNSEATP